MDVLNDTFLGHTVNNSLVYSSFESSANVLDFSLLYCDLMDTDYSRVNGRNRLYSVKLELVFIRTVERRNDKEREDKKDRIHKKNRPPTNTQDNFEYSEGRTK